jgi:hypothetical protein
LLVRRIPYYDQKPTDAERFLVEDHASPAGYRVASLPDYEIDPALARTGSSCMSPNFLFAVGLIMAFAVGGCITYLSFTEFDQFINDQVDNVIPT